MQGRGQFRVCPFCGDHIDSGEICDCQKKKEEAAPAGTGTTSKTKPKLVYHPGSGTVKKVWR